MSGRKKASAYLLLTVVLIGISWWLQAGLRPLTADGVRQAIGWLLYSGMVLLGIGLYRRRGADAVFFDAVGGSVLVTWAVTFLLYGGMDNAAATGADTAANSLMLLWTSLPLTALIRAAVLVNGVRREDTPARARPLRMLLVLLIVWILILVAGGQFLGFVRLSV